MTHPSVVLHVSQPTDAGVPAVVAALVRDQIARGWTVVVASPDDGYLRNEVVAAGAGHVSWAATRSPGPRTATEVLSMQRAIASVGPDLVHLHSSKAGVAGRLALRGRLPTVFQPHGWSFWAAGRGSRVPARTWERWSARWTDALVCVSKDEHAAGLAAGISAPWVLVPNGVDLTRWTPAGEDAKVAARGQLGLGGEPIVVCVGRLTRQKGQDVLLTAWPAVRERIDDARLILIGEGPDRGALEGRAVPGVELAGHRDDVADWIAAADLVVLPSRWEGMSLSLLEAMARARPVIATDVAGMREVLSMGGGEVVPAEDAGALARSIGTRLAERQILGAEGARARATIESRYDIRSSLERIAQLYADILDRRRRRQV